MIKKLNNLSYFYMPYYEIRTKANKPKATVWRGCRGFNYKFIMPVRKPDQLFGYKLD